MATLTDVLADPAKKQGVIRDAAALIDEEVARKRGLRAAALKAGYRTVKTMRPGMIEHALDRLLPEFAPAVDPHHERARQSDQGVEAYFRSHSAEIADALLGVTDRRAERAQNRVLKRVYSGLRSQAKAHVQDATPGLARLIEKHVA